MQIKRLQTKILLGLVGLVILLGATTVIFIKTVIREKFEASLEKRGIFIAKTVANDSITPLLTDKFHELEMMARDLKASEGDIEYIFIVNAHGDVVAHSFENGFPTDLKKISGAMNGRGYRIERLESEKGTILDFSVPIMTGEVGVVHVGMAEQLISRDVRGIIASLTGIIFAILIVGSGLAVVFAAAITKPVKVLAGAAKAAGGGNLTQMIRVKTADEIGQLGAAFNVMMAQRKEAEDRLRASEKKLRDITAHLAEGLYVLDITGKITFMNPEAERLLGWTAEELNAQGAHQLIHYRRPDGTALSLEECHMHNVINTGETYVTSDEVFVRRDGTVFPVSVVSSPIFENGAIIASVTSFRDISRTKELEQEREQLLLAYEDALNNIKTLKGLMPICASCKRIRDDKGYWNQIESYIQEHSDAEFSHGICPECAKKIYPDFYPDRS